MIVLVPSRGRPQNIKRLIDAWELTGASAELWVLVDNDDDSLADYLGMAHDSLQVFVGEHTRIGPRLNEAVATAARQDRYVGFMGDDHCPRTNGWDDRVTDALDHLGHGFVYCDDTIQSAALPTQVFMTSDIPLALGYMCPPGLLHMYLDNAWLDWGRGMGRMMYLGDVKIEHLHPIVGKSGMDATYESTAWLMGPDGERYEEYKRTTLHADVEKLKGLL